jgi:hypothetical protein
VVVVSRCITRPESLAKETGALISIRSQNDPPARNKLYIATVCINKFGYSQTGEKGEAVPLVIVVASLINLVNRREMCVEFIYHTARTQSNSETFDIYNYYTIVCLTHFGFFIIYIY